MTSRSVAIYGLYLAIFLLMGLVPQVGYITILPGVTMTTISIPVIVITLHLGWRGALFGVFMWGLTAVMALPIQGVAVLAYYGWGKSIIIFFLGRMIIFIPILALLCLDKHKKLNKVMLAVISGIIIVYTNTFVVIALLVLLAPSTSTFAVIFTSQFIGIMIEWFVIPFAICPALSTLINYMRVNEKMLNSFKW